MRSRSLLLSLVFILASSAHAGARRRAVVRPAATDGFAAAIVYTQARVDPGDVVQIDLMLMNADGTETRRRLEGTTGVFIKDPSFSPDGSNIAFHSNVDGPGIYVVQTAGSTSPRKIVSVQANPWVHPEWSPDGRFIAFTDLPGPGAGQTAGSVASERRPAVADQDLHIIEVGAGGDLVAGTRKALATTPDRLEIEPAWSRDSRRLSSHVFVNGDLEVFVYTFDPGKREITSSESLTASLGPRRIFGAGKPRWNKSAAMADVILFSAYSTAQRESPDLWYVYPDSRQIGSLLRTTGFAETDPNFSPDDTRVLFLVDSADGFSGLFILQNARDLLLGSSGSALVAETKAKATPPILDFPSSDWRRVP